jgi:AraC-like DNA-binding protein
VFAATVDDVDAYSVSVAGILIETVRTGFGIGPNRVLALREDRFVFSSCDIGFPFRSRTTLGDDQVAVATIIDAPPSSRWCSIDLEPGAVIVYGPGAEHTAVNVPGLSFAFATLDLEQLDDLADRYQTPISIPSRGEVRQLARSANTRATTIALPVLAHADKSLPDVLGRQCNDAARALALTLTEDHTVWRMDGGTEMDTRRVVHACLEYAEATQRIPSIGELCLTVHVSERKLRTAFNEEFSQPPSQFFRDWALQQTHRRLRNSELDGPTVTDIATDVGFAHLGRFAGYYRSVYGENPSTTLRKAPRSVG